MQRSFFFLWLAGVVGIPTRSWWSVWESGWAVQWRSEGPAGPATAGGPAGLKGPARARQEEVVAVTRPVVTGGILGPCPPLKLSAPYQPDEPPTIWGPHLSEGSSAIWGAPEIRRGTAIWGALSNRKGSRHSDGPSINLRGPQQSESRPPQIWTALAIWEALSNLTGPRQFEGPSPQRQHVDSIQTSLNVDDRITY